MAKDGLVPVKEATHKLQLCLFNGIHHEGQLFAAGSLMSQSDYQDVVIERSIANMCGYPLCNNALPSERSGRKGRYRISLKEHKVYDLHETYMYCSTSCVVNSQAFAGSLQEERCSVLHPSKLDEVLRLFEEMSVNPKEDELGRNGDLGLSELKIQEKEDFKVGEVSMEEWIGPSNAIEGYVPQRDQNTKALNSKNRKEVSKPSYIKPDKEKDMMFNEFDFLSTLITQDEYSISKLPSPLLENGSSSKVKGSKRELSFKEMDNHFTAVDTPYDRSPSSFKSNLEEINEEKIVIDMNDKLHISEVSNGLSERQSCPSVDVREAEKGSYAGKAAQSNASVLRPSLKLLSSKKVTRSVTWADEKTAVNGSLREIRESEETTAKGFSHSNLKEDDNSSRLSSAEACALALSQAAEAVASGVCDVPDAVSEAGIILLPQPPSVVEEDPQEEMDVDIEPALIKWPRKQGISHSDFFDSEDSWYDNPPEGFNLNLSPFATMFMALFAWISSSSLAYIYGRDESFHEEYLTVNGREYPRKVVYSDGRSSEIRQTLAGCLARALPGFVADLRLPTPISTLEQGMSCLLDTMSFMDPLPPFRIKQWQVIVLLFIDALSVSRILSITPHMTSGRRLFHKVLDGAQISSEEYELMKDLVIPLGRIPQFSAQSGG